MAGHGRETPPEGAFLDHALAEVAARQHAVFSLSQLVDLGLAASTARRRAAAGRLHRVHRGVYSLIPVPLLTREGHWMAATLACGPRAVLSHRTAAALHGLRPTARTKIDVTVAARSARRIPGLDIHRSTTLTRADVVAVNGIPCTSVARTLLDLAAVVPQRALERAYDQAEICGALNLNAINRQLEMHPTHRGAPATRAVLSEHYIGATATQSELEEVFLALCRRAGVPDPQVNAWVDLGDGAPPIWADFVWREARVIVESDGAKFHGTHQARQRDPRRDQRALLAGWRPLRTTWLQVTRRPRELEATIVRLVCG